jgi:hypothetical protein
VKTDKSLRITRSQYRQLAEIAKQNGVGLALDTFTNMDRMWGCYNAWAKPIVRDVMCDRKQVEERIAIVLSTSVNAGVFRREVRPELDWSQLADDEIYPFLACHEIGHHIDNFSFWDVMAIENVEVREQCRAVATRVNEMLADRFAWEQIRPGEPVPLCEWGQANAEVMANDLHLLQRHIPRTRRSPQALPPGQYSYVPASMLRTEELAAFVGPHVSPALIETTRNSRRVHRRDSRLRG